MSKRARSKWSKGERKLEWPFAPFPCEMVESPAFRVLSESAFKVLFHLVSVWAHNGGLKHNTNGKLIVSYRGFCNFWRMSMRSVMRAIHELEALGFLEKTVQGCAGNADERQPNQYRLTFLPSEGAPGTGSHEWRRIKALDEALAERRKPTERNGRRVRHHEHGAGIVTHVTDKKQNLTCPKGVTSLAQSKAKGVPRDGYGTDIPHAQSKAFSIYWPLSLTAADPGSVTATLDPKPTGPRSEGEIDVLRAFPGSAAKISRFRHPRCGACGADILSRQIDARYCSPACRKRAHRRRAPPLPGLAKPK